MNPFLLALMASAGLGALIGLIRQWSEQVHQPPGTEYSGVRTFTFWSVLGCVAAFLSADYSPAVLPVVVAVVGGYFAARQWGTPAGGPGGSTTFAASLLTVLIGALVYWRHHQEAVLISATAAVLLGLKSRLHALTRAFTDEDIRATLQFVAITGVILPLVPDHDLGPFGGFNPFSTWLMVVLISGLGFTGYVAMRLLGTSAGIVLTSLLGGLASSTATTLAFSRRSREDPAFSRHYALAVVAACSMMLPRVLVAIGVFNRDLAWHLLAPFAGMAVPAVAYGVWLWFRRPPGRDKLPAPALTNPLSLLTAVKFALFYAAIAFLVKAAASLELLHTGLLPLSFVSGLTDMDAISLSVVGNFNTGNIPLSLAAQAILVAAISNSLLKAGLAIALGSPELRRLAGGLLILTAAAGVAGWWFVA
jgi:uncharacterized membrane protein (DUF4010 family)